MLVEMLLCTEKSEGSRVGLSLVGRGAASNYMMITEYHTPYSICTFQNVICILRAVCQA